jgi:hypothetical protein
MGKSMTFSAKRNNIETMLSCVAKMVMVVFCAFSTVITEFCIYARKFSTTNKSIYYVCSSPLFWVIFVPFGVAFTLNITHPFKTSIFFVFFSGPVFFAINQVTWLTERLMTIFSFTVLRKFGNRLDCLANTTSFCYNPCSHIRTFLRLWLKPLASNELVTGLFYYTGKGVIVK